MGGDCWKERGYWAEGGKEGKMGQLYSIINEIYFKKEASLSQYMQCDAYVVALLCCYAEVQKYMFSWLLGLCCLFKTDCPH